MRPPIRHFLVAGLALAAMMLGSAQSSPAQALGWEGETGILVTPLAYTANVEKEKVHPVVAYHYMYAGTVIGEFHQASVTVGFLKHFELGYTHDFHAQGDDALSPLWQNGFEIFHGKAMVIPENWFNRNWVPAVSVGFMVRNNVRNLGDLQLLPGGGISPTSTGKTNEDVYVVGSKTIGKFAMVSAGVRGTNAELWGLAGDAPDRKARAFGSVALPFKLPGGNSITLAAEVAQQPSRPAGFPSLHIPTTMVYAARFAPNSKYHFTLDAGVAQIAGRVAPGVDLKARHQAAVGLSYAF